MAGPLTTAELDKALNLIVKSVQINMFPVEIKDLKNKKPINSRSRLLTLTPFLDDDGILRVGGRLKNSTYSNDKKHPIILSADSHLTTILFRSNHLQLLHAGPTLLLSTIRDKFWVTNGRNLARKIVKTCVKCSRFNPQFSKPIMGHLPLERIVPSSTYPFSTTGIDFAGPFWILDRKGRGSKCSKCYISLFVCFSTKALHLELVSDLSSQAFIQALRRFVSRRGKPAKLYSDNGSNFIGAQRELGEFLIGNKSKLIETCAMDKMEWQFLPPYAPHFGGLWEAGVRSVKHHLRRVIGSSETKVTTNV